MYQDCGNAMLIEQHLHPMSASLFFIHLFFLPIIGWSDLHLQLVEGDDEGASLVEAASALTIQVASWLMTENCEVLIGQI